MTNWDQPPARKEPPPESRCAICNEPDHGMRGCLSHVMTTRIEQLKKVRAVLVAALNGIRESRNMTLLGRCCVEKRCVPSEDGAACELQEKVNAAFIQMSAAARDGLIEAAALQEKKNHA